MTNLEINAIRNMTDVELLRYVDRSNPVVNELAKRLEIRIQDKEYDTLPTNPFYTNCSSSA